MSEAPVVFCANCGAHLEPGAHFCGVCGHKVPGSEAPVALTAVASPVASAPVASTTWTEPIPPAAVPDAVPSGIEPNRPAPYVLILGALASLALVAAVVALVFALRRDDRGGPESFVVVTTAPAGPAATARSTTASTTSTTAATTTTTTAVTTTASPPITPVVPSPPDTFVWPDMTADAIGAVQGRIAACGQGGWVGDYSATAVADGRYRVGANAMFEGDTQSFPIAWEVDFTTNRTEVRPLDDGARALICMG